MDRFARIVFAVSLFFCYGFSITENECTVTLEFNEKNNLGALGVYSRDSLSVPSEFDLRELTSLSLVGAGYGAPYQNNLPVDIADCIRDERLGNLTNVKILNFWLDVSKGSSERSIRSESLELACKDFRSMKNCLSFFSPEKLKQLKVTLKRWGNCDYKFLGDFPELVSISICNLSEANSLNASQFFQSIDLSRVKTIQLSGFTITNEDMLQFQNLKVLQSLGLERCTVPASANQILAGLDSLESLSLEYCSATSESDLAHNDTEVVFKKLKTLKLAAHAKSYKIKKMRSPEIRSLTIVGSLDLNDVRGLDLNQLRSLSLNHIPHEFDEQLLRIVSECRTNLEEIGLSYCSLSSASLEKLSGLPNLESLKLNSIEVFDGEPVFQINAKLAHLEISNLDVYPSRHTISKLTQLRSLTVRGGEETYLPCEGLKHLVLSNVDLNDAKLESFDGLKELSLRNCLLPEFVKSNSLPTSIKRLSLELDYLPDSSTVPLNRVITEKLSMLAARGYSVHVYFKGKTGKD